VLTVHRPNPQRRKEVDAVRRAALLFAGATIWLFLLAIPAMADNGPHVAGQNSTALQGSCAGCHRAHSGQAPYLVKAAMPTLCYSCHGAGGAGATTDVQDGVAYAATSTTHAGTLDASGGTSVSLASVSGALRGGGFQYALINTNPGAVLADSNRTIGVLSAGAATTSSHSVDGTPVTMWGAGALGTPGVGTANVDLTCASCHDPHGNGQYRILKPLPDDATTGTAAVKIIDATAGTSMVYTTTNYGVLGEMAADPNTPLNPDGSSLQYDTAAKTYTGTFLEASSRWCATCHTRYMSYAGSAGNKSFTAAGTVDSVYKYRHAVRDIVDPATNGAPTTGVINPASGSSQLKGGATIGPLVSSGTGYSYTTRGIAVSGTASGLNSAAAAGDLLTTSAPRCITCHVAHGSDAAVGTFASTGTSLVTGTLDSALLRLDGRGVCQNCHKK
jgi:predicted CXXCH cytochrome family protein